MYTIKGPKQLKFDKITLTKGKEPEGWDEEVVETAGFIPLAVRFKQMEQAGLQAQFFESEFSSKDVTDMYLNHPEFDLTPEDDLEDAIEKMQLREAYIQSVKEAVRAKNEDEAKREVKASEAKAKARSKETASEVEEKSDE